MMSMRTFLLTMCLLVICLLGTTALFLHAQQPMTRPYRDSMAIEAVETNTLDSLNALKASITDSMTAGRLIATDSINAPYVVVAGSLKVPLLVVGDTTQSDFLEPQDSTGVKVAGYDIPGDVLVSSRNDTTDNSLFLNNSQYVASGEWVFWDFGGAYAGTRYDPANNEFVISLANEKCISLKGDTIQLQSIGETGVAWVLADSSGDMVAEYYNAGGVKFGKSWGGQNQWGVGMLADTLVIPGITASCPVLITPHDGASQDIWISLKTDTVFVHRTVSGEVDDEHYSYLIQRP
jgi:hypothetical protein